MAAEITVHMATKDLATRVHKALRRRNILSAVSKASPGAWLRVIIPGTMTEEGVRSTIDRLSV